MASNADMTDIDEHQDKVADESDNLGENVVDEDMNEGESEDENENIEMGVQE